MTYVWGLCSSKWQHLYGGRNESKGNKRKKWNIVNLESETGTRSIGGGHFDDHKLFYIPLFVFDYFLIQCGGQNVNVGTWDFIAVSS
jgi:hypothetical protein